MKYIINRESILHPLTQVSNVVEKKQTLPILSNVYMLLDNNQLRITGTDLEVEVSTWTDKVQIIQPGQCTVNAKKLLDICRALAEGSDIEISTENEQLHIQSGKSKFDLKTLNADDYPRIETKNWEERFQMTHKSIRHLINKTYISMAHQDVRYFLNGILFDINKDRVTAVATDGHRLSKTEEKFHGEINNDGNILAIVPRKAILELAKIFSESDKDMVTIEMNHHHIRFTLEDYIFTSKLIDGKFPDYKSVMNVSLPVDINLERSKFLDVLQRASILTNEKFRGVRLKFYDNTLTVTSNNPDQEQATDEMSIEFNDNEIEIGFNVSYIIDILRLLNNDHITLRIRDSNSSCTIDHDQDEVTKYLIMPMRI